MLAHVIDPDSAVPPYEQVAKMMMRDEIAQGAMTGRIPSLHTIAEHHHVSHRVAARALEILKGEGMIIDVPGEGEFVRLPKASKEKDKAPSPELLKMIASLPAGLRIRVARITDGTVTVECAGQLTEFTLRRPQLSQHHPEEEEVDLLKPLSER